MTIAAGGYRRQVYTTWRVCTWARSRGAGLRGCLGRSQSGEEPIRSLLHTVTSHKPVHDAVHWLIHCQGSSRELRQRDTTYAVFLKIASALHTRKVRRSQHHNTQYSDLVRRAFPLLTNQRMRLTNENPPYGAQAQHLGR